MVNEILTGLLAKIGNSESEEYRKNIAEYFQSVEKLSEEGWNLEFNNRDANHASIVMTFLFKKAVREIKIFAGNFGGSVCDNDSYIESLTEAIKRNVQVDIVFEEQPNSRSKCLARLIELKNSGCQNVTIRLITATTKQAIIKNKLKHFSTIDGNKFRYETDVLSFKAFCNFHDPETALLLKGNFLKLANGSLDYFR